MTAKQALEKQSENDKTSLIEGTQFAACPWKESEEAAWHTECGETHVFIVDGPTEKKHKFCPYCGERVEAKQFAEGEFE